MKKKTKNTSNNASCSIHVQGHQAYHSGISKDECPHDNMLDVLDWEMGWEDAKAGIPERF